MNTFSLSTGKSLKTMRKTPHVSFCFTNVSSPIVTKLLYRKHPLHFCQNIWSQNNLSILESHSYVTFRNSTQLYPTCCIRSYNVVAEAKAQKLTYSGKSVRSPTRSLWTPRLSLCFNNHLSAIFMSTDKILCWVYKNCYKKAIIKDKVLAGMSAFLIKKIAIISI